MRSKYSSEYILSLLKDDESEVNAAFEKFKKKLCYDLSLISASQHLNEVIKRWDLAKEAYEKTVSDYNEKLEWVQLYSQEEQNRIREEMLNRRKFTFVPMMRRPTEFYKMLSKEDFELYIVDIAGFVKKLSMELGWLFVATRGAIFPRLKNPEFAAEQRLGKIRSELRDRARIAKEINYLIKLYDGLNNHLPVVEEDGKGKEALLEVAPSDIVVIGETIQIVELTIKKEKLNSLAIDLMKAGYIGGPVHTFVLIHTKGAIIQAAQVEPIRWLKGVTSAAFFYSWIAKDKTWKKKVTRNKYIQDENGEQFKIDSLYSISSKFNLKEIKIRSKEKQKVDVRQFSSELNKLYNVFASYLDQT